MATPVGQITIEMAANVARLSRDMEAAKRTVSGAMQDITRSVNSARNAFVALAAVSLGGGLRTQLSAITGAIDAYNKFEVQLKLATKSQQEFITAQAEVKRIANVAQADLEGVGILYARVSNSLTDYGASAKQVAAITEAFSLTLKLSGATAQESRSAIIQFSQAMAAGALRSEEFNSVAEAAPKYMRLLAESLGVPVGALKKMGAEGKLTTEVLANALIPALDQLRDDAGKIQTIGGAFTRLRNSIVETLGELDKSVGITQNIAAGFKFVADNGRELVVGLTGIVATGIVAYLASLVARGAEVVASLIAQAVAAGAARNAMVAKTAADVASATATLNLAKSTEAASVGFVAQEAAALQTRIAMQNLTAAQAAQTVAASGATTAGTAFRAIVAGLGGPISALITVLGLAATAWMVFRDNTEKAGDSIDKLREKQRLLNDEVNRTSAVQGAARQLELEKQRADLLADLEVRKKRIADLDKQLMGNMLETERTAVKGKLQDTLVDIELATKRVGELDKSIADQKQAVESLKTPTGMALTRTATDLAEAWKNSATEAEKFAETQSRILADVDRLKAAYKDNLLANFADTPERAANLEATSRAFDAYAQKIIAAERAKTSAYKDSAKELDKQQAFFESTRESVTQRIQNLVEERDTVDGATDAEKLRNKILFGQDAAFRSLNPQQQAYIRALLDGAVAVQDEITAQKELNERVQKAADAYMDVAMAVKEATLSGYEYAVLQERIKGLTQEDAERVVKARQDIEALASSYERLRGAQSDTTALQKQNKDLELQIATLFGGAEAVAEYTARELERRAAIEMVNAAIIEQQAIGKDNEAQLKEQADAIRAYSEELTKQAAATRQGGALQKQLDFANDIKDAFSQVGQAFANSLFDGARKGKSFVKDLLDYISAGFRNLVLRLVINPVFNAIGGALTSTLFSGSALASQGAAAGGSFGGGFLNALSGGKTIFDALSGSLTSGISGFATQLGNLGFNSGAQFFNGFASALNGGSAATFSGASSAFNFGNFAGQAAPFLPAVFSLLQGDFKGAAFSGGGAAIGSIFGGPVGGAIGSVVGSLLGGLFGGKGGTPHRGGSFESIADGGSLTGTNTTGTILRADGRTLGAVSGQAAVGDALKPVTQQLAQVLNALTGKRVSVAAGLGADGEDPSQAYLKILVGTKTALNGVNPDLLTFNTNLKKAGEEFAKFAQGGALAFAAQNSGDAVLAAAFAQFKVSKTDKTGATVLDLKAAKAIDPAAVQAVAQGFIALSDNADKLQQTLGLTKAQVVALGNASGSLSGTVQSLLSIISDVPVTQADIDAKLRKVSESFAALGVAMPTTTEGFRDLIRGIDQTTESGRSLTNSLLGLAPAFGSAIQAAQAFAAQAAANQQQAGQALLGVFAEFGSNLDAFNQAVSASQSNLFQAQQKVMQAAQTAAAEAASKQQEAQQALLGVFAEFGSNLEAANQAVAAAQSNLAQAQNAVRQGQASLLRDTVSAYRSASQSIQSVIDRILGVARNDGGNLSAGKAQFADLVAKARLGDKDALAALPDMATSLTDLIGLTAVSREDQLKQLGEITDGLDLAKATADRQANIADDQLRALVGIETDANNLEALQQAVVLAQQQLTSAQAQQATAQAAFDTAQNQLVSLGLINTSVQSLGDRFAAALNQYIAADQQKAIANDQLATLVGINADTKNLAALQQEVVLAQQQLSNAQAQQATAQAALDNAKEQLTALGLINTSVQSLGDRFAAALGQYNTAAAATAAATAALSAKTSSAPSNVVPINVNIGNATAEQIATGIATTVVRQTASIAASQTASIAASQTASIAASQPAATKTAFKANNIFQLPVQQASTQTIDPLSFFNIPKRAAGGPAMGLTLVGERGPELVDFRSPVNVVSNQNSRALLDDSGIVEELRALRDEVSNLRAEARSSAVSNKKTADLLTRATDGGADYIRTQTAA